MERQRQATWYAIAAVLLWSTVATAFKLTLRRTGPVTMLLWAAVTSAAALLLMVAARGRLRDLLPTSPAELLRSVLLGFLNPFLYYLVLFQAYHLLPAQEAQPLNYTWPIVLALLSALLLRQRIGIFSLSAIAVSFLGVLVISTHGDLLALRFSHPGGAALALGSSAIWATYWILNLRDSRDEVVKLAAGFTCGALFVLAYAIARGEPLLTPLPALIGSVYIGLFEMGLTFVIWLRALTLSRTTAQVGNLVYASPFISLFFIGSVVGETIRPSSLLGLALIVSGILLQQHAARAH